MLQVIELLKQLIATPSVSRDEKAAADVLAAYMTRRGLRPQREGNNLWAVAPDFDPARPTLLLNAHIDTVPPTAGWQRHPYTPQEEDGRLYGLGSNDCGGGLVALLEAFCRLSAKPQPYNLIYAASAEEEVSGADGFTRLLPKLPKIDLAIVGEPTSLQPATSERGLMVLDVTAHGKAGHAAREEGVNAIYCALEDIKWFRTYRFPKVSPQLGPVKMSVTIIQAGTRHNCVPDACQFTVDVRVNECYTNEEVLAEVKAHVRAEVKARSTRLCSSSTPLDHPVVRRAVELGLVPFGSPTLSDQALMPFPSLKLGPGDSARSHTADEYIELSSIPQAVALYMQLLDGTALS